MPYNLSIPGQVSEHQLKAIEAVAALVPKNGKVVEVGSLFGCSSWAWAKSVDPSVTVYCIDPWEKNEGVRSMEARLGITYGIEQFKKHTADCPNITALQGYSPVHFLDWSDPIDLYYEDAVHNDPILGQNLDFWSARLKPTGIICGDDYRPRFPDVMNGAKRLADRFQRAFIRVDFFWCLLPNDSVLPGAAAVAIRLKELSAEHDALKRGRGPVFYIGPRMPIEPVAEGASTVVTCRVSNESLDPWPTEASKPHIIASVRVTSEAEPDFVLAEVRQPLPVTQLAPDVPVDYRIGLPTATLAAGNYRLVFDMVGPDGAYAASNNAARAPHSALAVLQAGAVAEAGSPTTPTLTAGPGASSSTGKRRPLIDTDVAQRELTSTAFADSHGAFSRHLGAGMLYYALGHLVRSQVSVCIGSGGGFVPSLMRRAQLDADIAPAITYLIDANLPDLAFGSPVQAGGWMTVENKFLDRERDIVVLPMLSVDAAALLAHNNILVDYLHIDGDHSAKGVLSDFQAFAPLLSAHAVVSLHDLRMPGVDQALTAILAAQPDLEMIGFREIGNGTGVLRRRGALDVPRRPQTVADLGDLSRKTSIDPVGVQTAIDDSNHRSRFERWSYLDTPTYQTRYRLVTDWIDRPGEAIVEIGGYPNSIVHFAKNATAVHAIEPYTTAVFEARFKDAATQNGILAMLHRMAVGSLSLDSSGFVPFNLVALGLDITSGARTPSEITASLQRLLELIGKAQRVALEVPSYKPSILTLDHILRIAQPTVVHDMTLDLSKDPAADSFHVRDARAVRRLLLLEPRRGIELSSSGTQTLITEASAQIYALIEAQMRPVETSYELGTPIDFVLDGNAGPYKRGGWVGPEKRHTWMQTNESWLHFCPTGLDLLPLDAMLELKLDATPFVVPGKIDKQRIEIRINGVEVLSTAISERTTISCRFSVAVAVAETPMRVALMHPDATRPSDVIPSSKDLKPLAIAVHRMVLDRAT